MGKYLLPCCCIRDSLKFDLHHVNVLKKLEFDLFTPPQGLVGGGLRAKYLLLCCSIINMICNMTMF